MAISERFGRSFSRREALKIGLIGAGGTILAACAPAAPSSATPAAKPTVAPEPTPVTAKPTEAPKSTAAAQAAPSGKIIEIVWSTWAGGDAEVKLKQQTVEEFSNTVGKQKGIKATARIITDYASYFTKLETSFAGGDAPDAVWTTLDKWGKWIPNGWLRDLTPLVQMEKADSPIQQAYKKLPDWNYKFLGKTYAIPHLVQIMGTWVNKEMFDKAGIPLPPLKWNDPSWTVDKITEIALALTKRTSSGKIEQLGVEIPCCFTGYGPGYALIQSNGGQVFSADFSQWKMYEPAAAQVVQWAYDLVNKHKVAPLVQDSKAGLTFWTGKVGMQIAWLTWPARVLESSQGQWTPSPHPLPKFKETKEWAHGIQIAASSQSKYPEAVVDFGRWMVSDGDKLNVALGYCAPLTEEQVPLLMTNAPGLPEITEGLKKLPREPFLEALDYAKDIQNPFFTRYYLVNQEVWTPKVHDVLVSGRETDAAKLLTAVKPDVEKILVEAQEDLKKLRG